MAWYDITYACGHEGREQIYGPLKDRQWIADSKSANLCPDCYEKYLAEKREQENAQAAERAKELSLPELSGTEKQVAWANTLRQNLLDTFNDLIEKMGDEESREYRRFSRKNITVDEVKRIRDFIMRHRTEAKYYIDSRFERIERYIEFERENVPASLSGQNSELQLEADAKAESTVYPENRVTNAVAEISVQTGKVTVMFEKNEKFREIVKSLGYKWNDIWVKKINETTGTAEERAAELGNKLLNAGFPVCIFDETVRNNAINGVYEPECKRWIYRRQDTEYLAINWTDRSDMYEKARSLPGSKWDSPSVLVRVEHFEAVEDFAALYGFRFTRAAQALIEQHKNRLKQALVVNPAKPIEEKKAVDGLSDILASSDTVLADLVDED